MCGDDLIFEGGVTWDYVRGFVAGKRWAREVEPSLPKPVGTIINPERDIIRSEIEIVEDYHGKAQPSA